VYGTHSKALAKSDESAGLICTHVFCKILYLVTHDCFPMLIHNFPTNTAKSRPHVPRKYNKLERLQIQVIQHAYAWYIILPTRKEFVSTQAKKVGDTTTYPIPTKDQFKSLIMPRSLCMFDQPVLNITSETQWPSLSFVPQSKWEYPAVDAIHTDLSPLSEHTWLTKLALGDPMSEPLRTLRQVALAEGLADPGYCEANATIDPAKAPLSHVALLLREICGFQLARLRGAPNTIVEFTESDEASSPAGSGGVKSSDFSNSSSTSAAPVSQAAIKFDQVTTEKPLWDPVTLFCHDMKEFLTSAELVSLDALDRRIAYLEGLIAIAESPALAQNLIRRVPPTLAKYAKGRPSTLITSTSFGSGPADSASDAIQIEMLPNIFAPADIDLFHTLRAVLQLLRIRVARTVLNAAVRAHVANSVASIREQIVRALGFMLHVLRSNMPLMAIGSTPVTFTGPELIHALRGNMLVFANPAECAEELRREEEEENGKDEGKPQGSEHSQHQRLRVEAAQVWASILTSPTGLALSTLVNDPAMLALFPPLPGESATTLKNEQAGADEAEESDQDEGKETSDILTRMGLSRPLPPWTRTDEAAELLSVALGLPSYLKSDIVPQSPTAQTMPASIRRAWVSVLATGLMIAKSPVAPNAAKAAAAARSSSSESALPDWIKSAVLDTCPYLAPEGPKGREPRLVSPQSLAHDGAQMLLDADFYAGVFPLFQGDAILLSYFAQLHGQVWTLARVAVLLLQSLVLDFQEGIPAGLSGFLTLHYAGSSSNPDAPGPGQSNANQSSLCQLNVGTTVANWFPHVSYDSSAERHPDIHFSQLGTLVSTAFFPAILRSSSSAGALEAEAPSIPDGASDSLQLPALAVAHNAKLAKTLRGVSGAAFAGIGDPVFPQQLKQLLNYADEVSHEVSKAMTLILRRVRTYKDIMLEMPAFQYLLSTERDSLASSADEGAPATSPAETNQGTDLLEVRAKLGLSSPSELDLKRELQRLELRFGASRKYRQSEDVSWPARDKGLFESSSEDDSDIEDADEQVDRASKLVQAAREELDRLRSTSVSKNTSLTATWPHTKGDVGGDDVSDLDSLSESDDASDDSVGSAPKANDAKDGVQPPIDTEDAKDDKMQAAQRRLRRAQLALRRAERIRRRKRLLRLEEEAWLRDASLPKRLIQRFVREDGKLKPLAGDNWLHSASTDATDALLGSATTNFTDLDTTSLADDETRADIGTTMDLQDDPLVQALVQEAISVGLISRKVPMPKFIQGWAQAATQKHDKASHQHIVSLSLALNLAPDRILRLQSALAHLQSSNSACVRDRAEVAARAIRALLAMIVSNETRTQTTSGLLDKSSHFQRAVTVSHQTHHWIGQHFIELQQAAQSNVNSLTLMQVDIDTPAGIVAERTSTAQFDQTASGMRGRGRGYSTARHVEEQPDTDSQTLTPARSGPYIFDLHEVNADLQVQTAYPPVQLMRAPPPTSTTSEEGKVLADLAVEALVELGNVHLVISWLNNLLLAEHYARAFEVCTAHATQTRVYARASIDKVVAAQASQKIALKRSQPLFTLAEEAKGDPTEPSGRLALPVALVPATSQDRINAAALVEHIQLQRASTNQFIEAVRLIKPLVDVYVQPPVIVGMSPPFSRLSSPTQLQLPTLVHVPSVPVIIAPPGSPKLSQSENSGVESGLSSPSTGSRDTRTTLMGENSDSLELGSDTSSDSDSDFQALLRGPTRPRAQIVMPRALPTQPVTPIAAGEQDLITKAAAALAEAKQAMKNPYEVLFGIRQAYVPSSQSLEKLHGEPNRRIKNVGSPGSPDSRPQFAKASSQRARPTIHHSTELFANFGLGEGLPTSTSLSLLAMSPLADRQSPTASIGSEAAVPPYIVLVARTLKSLEEDGDLSMSERTAIAYLAHQSKFLGTSTSPDISKPQSEETAGLYEVFRPRDFPHLLSYWLSQLSDTLQTSLGSQPAPVGPSQSGRSVSAESHFDHASVVERLTRSQFVPSTLELLQEASVGRAPTYATAAARVYLALAKSFLRADKLNFNPAQALHLLHRVLQLDPTSRRLVLEALSVMVFMARLYSHLRVVHSQRALCFPPLTKEGKEYGKKIGQAPLSSDPELSTALRVGRRLLYGASRASHTMATNQIVLKGLVGTHMAIAAGAASALLAAYVSASQAGRPIVLSTFDRNLLSQNVEPRYPKCLSPSLGVLLTAADESANPDDPLPSTHRLLSLVSASRGSLPFSYSGSALLSSLLSQFHSLRVIDLSNTDVAYTSATGHPDTRMYPGLSPNADVSKVVVAPPSPEFVSLVVTLRMCAHLERLNLNYNPRLGTEGTLMLLEALLTDEPVCIVVPHADTGDSSTSTPEPGRNSFRRFLNQATGGALQLHARPVQQNEMLKSLQRPSAGCGLRNLKSLSLRGAGAGLLVALYLSALLADVEAMTCVPEELDLGDNMFGDNGLIAIASALLERHLRVQRLLPEGPSALGECYYASTALASHEIATWLPSRLELDKCGAGELAGQAWVAVLTALHRPLVVKPSTPSAAKSQVDSKAQMIAPPLVLTSVYLGASSVEHEALFRQQSTPSARLVPVIDSNLAVYPPRQATQTNSAPAPTLPSTEKEFFSLGRNSAAQAVTAPQNQIVFAGRVLPSGTPPPPTPPPQYRTPPIHELLIAVPPRPLLPLLARMGCVSQLKPESLHILFRSHSFAPTSAIELAALNSLRRIQVPPPPEGVSATGQGLHPLLLPREPPLPRPPAEWTLWTPQLQAKLISDADAATDRYLTELEQWKRQYLEPIASEPSMHSDDVQALEDVLNDAAPVHVSLTESSTGPNPQEVEAPALASLSAEVHSSPQESSKLVYVGDVVSYPMDPVPPPLSPVTARLLDELAHYALQVQKFVAQPEMVAVKSQRSDHGTVYSSEQAIVTKAIQRLHRLHLGDQIHSLPQSLRLAEVTEDGSKLTRAYQPLLRLDREKLVPGAWLPPINLQHHVSATRIASLVGFFTSACTLMRHEIEVSHRVLSVAYAAAHATQLERAENSRREMEQASVAGIQSDTSPVTNPAKPRPASALDLLPKAPTYLAAALTLLSGSKAGEDILHQLPPLSLPPNRMPRNGLGTFINPLVLVVYETCEAVRDIFTQLAREIDDTMAKLMNTTVPTELMKVSSSRGPLRKAFVALQSRLRYLDAVRCTILETSVSRENSGSPVLEMFGAIVEKLRELARSIQTELLIGRVKSALSQLRSRAAHLALGALTFAIYSGRDPRLLTQIVPSDLRGVSALSRGLSTTANALVVMSLLASGAGKCLQELSQYPVLELLLPEIPGMMRTRRSPTPIPMPTPATPHRLQKLWSLLSSSQRSAVLRYLPLAQRKFELFAPNLTAQGSADVNGVADRSKVKRKSVLHAATSSIGALAGTLGRGATTVAAGAADAVLGLFKRNRSKSTVTDNASEQDVRESKTSDEAHRTERQTKACDLANLRGETLPRKAKSPSIAATAEKSTVHNRVDSVALIAQLLVNGFTKLEPILNIKSSPSSPKTASIQGIDFLPTPLLSEENLVLGLGFDHALFGRTLASLANVCQAQDGKKSKKEKAQEKERQDAAALMEKASAHGRLLTVVVSAFISLLQNSVFMLQSSVSLTALLQQLETNPGLVLMADEAVTPEGQPRSSVRPNSMVSTIALFIKALESSVSKLETAVDSHNASVEAALDSSTPYPGSAPPGADLSQLLPLSVNTTSPFVIQRVLRENLIPALRKDITNATSALQTLAMISSQASAEVVVSRHSLHHSINAEERYAIGRIPEFFSYLCDKPTVQLEREAHSKGQNGSASPIVLLARRIWRFPRDVVDCIPLLRKPYGAGMDVVVRCDRKVATAEIALINRSYLEFAKKHRKRVADRGQAVSTVPPTLDGLISLSAGWRGPTTRGTHDTSDDDSDSSEDSESERKSEDSGTTEGMSDNETDEIVSDLSESVYSTESECEDSQLSDLSGDSESEEEDKSKQRVSQKIHGQAATVVPRIDDSEHFIVGQYFAEETGLLPTTRPQGFGSVSTNMEPTMLLLETLATTALALAPETTVPRGGSARRRKSSLPPSVLKTTPPSAIPSRTSVTSQLSQSQRPDAQEVPPTGPTVLKPTVQTSKTVVKERTREVTKKVVVKRTKQVPYKERITRVEKRPRSKDPAEVRAQLFAQRMKEWEETHMPLRDEWSGAIAELEQAIIALQQKLVVAKNLVQTKEVEVAAQQELAKSQATQSRTQAYERLKEIINAGEEGLADQIRKADQLREEILKCETALRERTSKLTEMRDSKNTLVQSIAAKRASAAEATEKWQTDLEAAQSMLKSLEEEVRRSEQALSDAKEQFALLQSTSPPQSSKLSPSSEDLQAAEIELDQLQKQLDLAEAELASTKVELRAADEKRARVVAAAQEFIKATRLRERLEQKRSELAACQSKQEKAKERLASIIRAGRVRLLTQTVSQRRYAEIRNEYEVKISDSQQKVKELQEHLDRLNQELEKNKKAQVAFAERQQRVNELVKQLESKEMELLQAQALADRAAAKESQRRTKLEDKKADLFRKREQEQARRIAEREARRKQLAEAKKVTNPAGQGTAATTSPTESAPPRQPGKLVIPSIFLQSQAQGQPTPPPLPPRRGGPPSIASAPPSITSGPPSIAASAEATATPKIPENPPAVGSSDSSDSEDEVKADTSSSDTDSFEDDYDPELDLPVPPVRDSEVELSDDNANEPTQIEVHLTPEKESEIHAEAEKQVPPLESEILAALNTSSSDLEMQIGVINKELIAEDASLKNLRDCILDEASLRKEAEVFAESCQEVASIRSQPDSVFVENLNLTREEMQMLCGEDVSIDELSSLIADVAAGRELESVDEDAIKAQVLIDPDSDEDVRQAFESNPTQFDIESVELARRIAAEKHADLEAQIAAFKTARTAAEERLKLVQQNKLEAATQCALVSSQDSLEKKQNDVVDAQAVHSKLIEELERARQQVTQLQLSKPSPSDGPLDETQVSTLEKDIAQAQEDVATLEDELSCRRALLLEQENQISALEAQIQAHKNEMEQIAHTLQDPVSPNEMKEVADIIAALESAKKEADELEAQIRSQSAEQQLLKVRLAELPPRPVLEDISLESLPPEQLVEYEEVEVEEEIENVREEEVEEETEVVEHVQETHEEDVSEEVEIDNDSESDEDSGADENGHERKAPPSTMRIPRAPPLAALSSLPAPTHIAGLPQMTRQHASGSTYDSLIKEMQERIEAIRVRLQNRSCIMLEPAPRDENSPVEAMLLRLPGAWTTPKLWNRTASTRLQYHLLEASSSRPKAVFIRNPAKVSDEYSLERVCGGQLTAFNVTLSSATSACVKRQITPQDPVQLLSWPERAWILRAHPSLADHAIPSEINPSDRHSSLDGYPALHAVVAAYDHVSQVMLACVPRITAILPRPVRYTESVLHSFTLRCARHILCGFTSSTGMFADGPRPALADHPTAYASCIDASLCLASRALTLWPTHPKLIANAIQLASQSYLLSLKLPASSPILDAHMPLLARRIVEMRIPILDLSSRPELSVAGLASFVRTLTKLCVQDMVQVQRSSLTENGASESFQVSLPLQYLSFASNRQFGDVGTVIVAKIIRRFPSAIKELSLAQTSMTTLGARALARAIIHSAPECIIARYNKRQHERLTDLPRLALPLQLDCSAHALSALTVLDLSHNKLGDSGVCALSKALLVNSLSTLRILRLDDVDAGPAAGRSLLRLIGYLPLLQKVSVKGNLGLMHAPPIVFESVTSSIQREAEAEARGLAKKRVAQMKAEALQRELGLEGLELEPDIYSPGASPTTLQDSFDQQNRDLSSSSARACAWESLLEQIETQAEQQKLQWSWWIAELRAEATARARTTTASGTSVSARQNTSDLNELNVETWMSGRVVEIMSEDIQTYCAATLDCLAEAGTSLPDASVLGDGEGQRSGTSASFNLFIRIRLFSAKLQQIITRMELGDCSLPAIHVDILSMAQLLSTWASVYVETQRRLAVEAFELAYAQSDNESATLHAKDTAAQTTMAIVTRSVNADFLCPWWLEALNRAARTLARKLYHRLDDALDLAHSDPEALEEAIEVIDREIFGADVYLMQQERAQKLSELKKHQIRDSPELNRKQGLPAEVEIVPIEQLQVIEEEVDANDLDEIIAGHRVTGRFKDNAVVTPTSVSAIRLRGMSRSATRQRGLSAVVASMESRLKSQTAEANNAVHRKSLAKPASQRLAASESFRRLRHLRALDGFRELMGLLPPALIPLQESMLRDLNELELVMHRLENGVGWYVSPDELGLVNDTSDTKQTLWRLRRLSTLPLADLPPLSSIRSLHSALSIACDRLAHEVLRGEHAYEDFLDEEVEIADARVRRSQLLHKLDESFDAEEASIREYYESAQQQQQQQKDTQPSATIERKPEPAEQNAQASTSRTAAVRQQTNESDLEDEEDSSTSNSSGASDTSESESENGDGSNIRAKHEEAESDDILKLLGLEIVDDNDDLRRKQEDRIAAMDARQREALMAATPARTIALDKVISQMTDQEAFNVLTDLMEELRLSLISLPQVLNPGYAIAHFLLGQFNARILWLLTSKFQIREITLQQCERCIEWLRHYERLVRSFKDLQLPERFWMPLEQFGFASPTSGCGYPLFAAIDPASKLAQDLRNISPNTPLSLEEIIAEVCRCSVAYVNKYIDLVRLTIRRQLLAVYNMDTRVLFAISQEVPRDQEGKLHTLAPETLFTAFDAILPPCLYTALQEDEFNMTRTECIRSLGVETISNGTSISQPRAEEWCQTHSCFSSILNVFIAELELHLQRIGSFAASSVSALARWRLIHLSGLGPQPPKDLEDSLALFPVPLAGAAPSGSLPPDQEIANLSTQIQGHVQAGRIYEQLEHVAAFVTAQLNNCIRYANLLAAFCKRTLVPFTTAAPSRSVFPSRQFHSEGARSWLLRSVPGLSTEEPYKSLMGKAVQSTCVPRILRETLKSHIEIRCSQLAGKFASLDVAFAKTHIGEASICLQAQLPHLLFQSGWINDNLAGISDLILEKGGDATHDTIQASGGGVFRYLSMLRPVPPRPPLRQMAIEAGLVDRELRIQAAPVARALINLLDSLVARATHGLKVQVIKPYILRGMRQMFFGAYLKCFIRNFEPKLLTNPMVLEHLRLDHELSVAYFGCLIEAAVEEAGGDFDMQDHDQDLFARKFREKITAAKNSDDEAEQDSSDESDDSEEEFEMEETTTSEVKADITTSRVVVRKSLLTAHFRPRRSVSSHPTQVMNAAPSSAVTSPQSAASTAPLPTSWDMMSVAALSVPQAVNPVAAAASTAVVQASKFPLALLVTILGAPQPADVALLFDCVATLDGRVTTVSAAEMLEAIVSKRPEWGRQQRNQLVKDYIASHQSASPNIQSDRAREVCGIALKIAADKNPLILPKIALTIETYRHLNTRREENLEVLRRLASEHHQRLQRLQQEQQQQQQQQEGALNKFKSWMQRAFN